MVRPFRFAFNAETAQNNFFQQEDASNDVPQTALTEFDAFVAQLRGKDVDVTVVQDSPSPWTPDSIFPNNWFSSHLSGELVLYPMFAENRRQERKRALLELLTRNMNHRKVIDLTHWENDGQFLEGTGSMVLDRDKRIAYCCRSPRTSEQVVRDFCARLNYDALLFDASDANGNLIYHTNVMMAIGTQVAIICLASIHDDDQKKKVVASLTSAGKIIVDISLNQVAHFAGNMLEVRSRNGQPIMVMSAAARSALTTAQENTIATYSSILSAPLSTIETNGGGSARCMMAEIFY